MSTQVILADIVSRLDIAVMHAYSERGAIQPSIGGIADTQYNHRSIYHGSSSNST